MVKARVYHAASDLNAAAIHLLRALRTVDDRSGLTPARLSALSVLVFSGPRTPARLAAAEGVTAPTMSGIIDGLVRLGLAERIPHPDHAHKVLVRPTEEGTRILHEARERRLAAIVTALCRLDTPAQQVVLEAAPHLVDLATKVVESP